MLEKVTEMRALINKRIENEIKPAFEKSKIQLKEFSSKIEYMNDQLIS